MERYWRIAIAVANIYLEDFLGDLGCETPLILEIADEIRQSANAKIWLFKYQRWAEDDALIKQLLATLFKLPDSAYLYIAIKRPFMNPLRSQGSFNAIEDFRPQYGTRTGIFFEDISF